MKKLLLGILIFILLINILIVDSLGANSDIMPLSLIGSDDVVTDDLGNKTYTYSVNMPTQVLTGNYVITKEFYDESLVNRNYAVLVCTSGVYLITTDKPVIGLHYFQNASFPSHAYGFTSDFSSYSDCILYVYNNDIGTFTSSSSYFTCGSFTPNSFVYISGCSVYLSYLGSSGSEPKQMKSQDRCEIYASQFNISEPELISYEDNILNFNLKSFYPGYSYQSETLVPGISVVSLSSMSDFSLYIYDSENSDFSITLDYEYLKNYIDGNNLKLNLIIIQFIFMNLVLVVYIILNLLVLTMVIHLLLIIIMLFILFLLKIVLLMVLIFQRVEEIKKTIKVALIRE